MQQNENKTTTENKECDLQNYYCENKEWFIEKMGVGVNFDCICRDINAGDTKISLFFIDGFCKDELMQKLMQYFLDIKKDDWPKSANDFIQKKLPYVEGEIQNEREKVLTSVFAGQVALLVEGYDSWILIDSRSYPVRSMEEPDKDKVLRGSKDGFVETLIFNVTLLRRRIRNEDLRIEICNVGSTSKTDIAFCYMKNRADSKLINKLKKQILSIQTDALSMNQESLAENLMKGKGLNPFPKFRYTQRPDTAAAQILEGSIIIFVDNSPQAMILPTSLFDIMEEANDYYFPPITGTYLKCAKFFILLVGYLLTPIFLLFTLNPEIVPESLSFILLKNEPNIPVFIQFIILEIALDGLRLASINTPDMLSTPLSVITGLVIGDFSASSGWFNPEVMLYMAFTALANYSLTNFELAYAVKFMRILTLILTQIFNTTGFVLGIVINFLLLIFNNTPAGRGYLYPLWPFSAKDFLKRFYRRNIKEVQIDVKRKEK